ncbi:MAG: recombinase family protein [Dorea sp.]|nr:recombinase family protein [Dorea sp.]
MGNVYGYCRISTKTQNIERQVRNIKDAFKDAVVSKEAFTGTKIQGRKELEKILNVVQPGDTIVFDEISRMSRNAEEGMNLYFELYEKGVSLVFLKERHIDTESYKNAMKSAGYDVSTDGTAQGELVADIMKALNKFMQAKVREDIRKAFDQAEKEVEFLHQRTKEGIETARLNGKQIGGVTGKQLNIKAKEPVKELIRKYSRTFGGNLEDEDVMALIRTKTYKKQIAEGKYEEKPLTIARNTYYKYKKEMLEEMSCCR